MAIAIFGGTFDPIHNGHLRAAIELYENLTLNEIRFIPCQQPVHKPKAMAASEHRINMLRLALTHLPYAIIDERELQRTSPSYTIETLTSLHLEFPKQRLCLIIGADAFENFTTWLEWQKILSLAHLIVIKRPGYESKHWNQLNLVNECEQRNFQTLLKQKAGGIFIQEIDGLAISSTQIRQLIMQNKNPQFLLPDTVLTYIRIHNLYKN